MNKTVFFFVLLLCTAMVFPQKRAYTLEDHYRVKSVSGPSLSPSGKLIAFTVTSFTLKSGKSATAVWLMNSDGSSQAELDLGEGSEYSPFWGGDDNLLYYTKTTDGATQLFSYDLKGKEARQLTDIYTGISSPVLSSDGKTLLFSAEVYPDCGADMDCNKKFGEASEDGPVQANMADELLFRHWTDYTGGKSSHIFQYSLSDKKLTDLTPGNWQSPVFSAGGGTGFVLSPDNKTVVFVSNREKDQAATTNADLWMTPLGTPGGENITAANKAWDGTPAFSPDGNLLAYRTQLLPGYEADKFRIAIYDLKSKTHRIISESFDNWVNDIVWAPDSKTIYFTGDVKGYTPVYKIDITGSKIEKVTGDLSVGSFSVSPDGKKLYYNYRLNHKPGEIYSFDLASKKEAQLTTFNNALLDEVDFRPMEHLWIDGAAGKKVHVLLVKPHGFDPAKKYPLVVNVHGGPQSQWQDAYRGDGQMYGGYGYVVAFPNPHGSTGYGQEYTAAISKDWGGKVYEDVMKVTEYLANLPYIDKNRVGAMGWSYGGYMMNWLQAKQGKSGLFKCFVSMMGLYNIESFYGTTEELWFPEWDLGGQPWNSELYRKFSPSEYVKNFGTPTLIITGEKDYRVSYTQSLEYFTALQKLGIDSRIIVYKNDGHWPSNLRSMPLYYNSHLEWFHKYLGGQPAPYDSRMMIRNSAY
ncbi:MAG: S9 family peptidase [Ignavibacteriaceae bacterium]|nr:S9 family peptidase [Ignavibacteriaceae bacterium]